MQIGEKIDLMYELREQKKQLESSAKDIKKQMDELEADILSQLDQMGTPSIAATKASATISELVVPTIEDWEAAQSWIRDNQFEHMYQRRLSSASYKEILDMGEDIPGVSPFTKRSISLRVKR